MFRGGYYYLHSRCGVCDPSRAIKRFNERILAFSTMIRHFSTLKSTSYNSSFCERPSDSPNIDTLPVELLLLIAKELILDAWYDVEASDLYSLSRASPSLALKLAPLLFSSLELTNRARSYTNFERLITPPRLPTLRPDAHIGSMRKAVMSYTLYKPQLAWVTSLRLGSTTFQRANQFDMDSFALVQPKFLPALRYVELLVVPSDMEVSWSSLKTALAHYETMPKVYMGCKCTLKDLAVLKGHDVLELVSGLTLETTTSQDGPQLEKEVHIEYPFSSMPLVEDLTIRGMDPRVFLKVPLLSNLKALYIDSPIRSAYRGLHWLTDTLEILRCPSIIFAPDLQEEANRLVEKNRLVDLTLTLSMEMADSPMSRLPFRNLKKFALKQSQVYLGTDLYMEPWVGPTLYNLLRDNENLESVEIEHLVANMMENIFMNLPLRLKHLSILEVEVSLKDALNYFLRKTRQETLRSLETVHFCFEPLLNAMNGRVNGQYLLEFPYELLSEMSAGSEPTGVNFLLFLDRSFSNQIRFKYIDKRVSEYAIFAREDNRLHHGELLTLMKPRKLTNSFCMVTDFGKLWVGWIALNPKLHF